MRWALFESKTVEKAGQWECFTRLCCILAVSHSTAPCPDSSYPQTSLLWCQEQCWGSWLCVILCVAQGQGGAMGKGARSSSFPSSGGRWKSWAQMSEGISAARTSASLFCIFYILFLLFILVPFLFSSWFISPPPVLFLPEEQHYPLLSLCTIFYFFPFAYCSAPCWFPHVVWLLSLPEENCSRAPLQCVCLLPLLLYICCSRRRECRRRGGRGGRSGRDMKQL